MVRSRRSVSARSESAPVSRPFTTTVPEVGVSTQPMRFRSVVFPDPDGPATARNSPCSTSIEASRTAGTSVFPSM